MSDPKIPIENDENTIKTALFYEPESEEGVLRSALFYQTKADKKMNYADALLQIEIGQARLGWAGVWDALKAAILNKPRHYFEAPFSCSFNLNHSLNDKRSFNEVAADITYEKPIKAKIYINGEETK